VTEPALLRERRLAALRAALYDLPINEWGDVVADVMLDLAGKNASLNEMHVQLAGERIAFRAQKAGGEH
jgi:hypothetical protein